MDHEQRMALTREISERLLAVHKDRVLAIGVYGSLAQGTDAPYSDIEMLCVLRTTGEERVYEWMPGPWKAEVNIYSRDRILEEAATVDERWPLTHDALCQMAMTGNLSDLERIFAVCEAFWTGVERWAEDRGLQIKEPSKIPF
jgi:predicted nucleotidyltransferase